jgi:hypothetical protein
MQTDHRQAETVPPSQDQNLSVGELVTVRSPSEILATLNERGELDELPFMPEMLQFSGKQFRVHKRAIKTCDTIGNTGMYRMERAVHLEGVRCDGQAHGGCQAACLIHWKEAWLKRAEPGQEPAATESLDSPAGAAEDLPVGAQGCTMAALLRATRAETSRPEDEVFSCQATEMRRAARVHLAGWDPRQYVADVRSGNARPLPMLRGLVLHLFNKFQTTSRRFLPSFLLVKGGGTYPFLQGRVVGRTPKEVLDLQPGELVEVKSEEEILQTLDKHNRNRGLRFGGGMLEYCGKRFRVLRRVEKIIDERTGKMLHFPGDAIILDGIVCNAKYELFCPREIYSYWREIWLRRVV